MHRPRSSREIIMQRANSIVLHKPQQESISKEYVSHKQTTAKQQIAAHTRSPPDKRSKPLA
eukprot:scaffold179_cov368-Prasinococcus_capsulatus_cf.AAC.48